MRKPARDDVSGGDVCDCPAVIANRLGDAQRDG